MLDQSLDTQTFVSHLECSETGKVYPADKIHNLSETGKPLLVRYDLDAVKRFFPKTALNGRLPEFWRYRELLPIRNLKNITRLGEVIPHFYQRLIFSLC